MFHQEVQLLLSRIKESSKSIQESPVKRALNDPNIVQKFYQFRANKDSFTKFMNKDYKKAKNELKSY
jgi:translation elongation factor P/translation initiation factor 5A